MGMFKVLVDVGDALGAHWEPVEMWVDSVAMYSWVPKDVLSKLGVQPQERLDLELADGSLVYRDLGETRVRYQGNQHHTLVVFGDEGSEALLGAYTLEGFRLGVDPVHKQLIPLPYAYALGFRLGTR